MANQGLEFKLKERVKELKFLYELSRLTLQSGNDLTKIINRTLTILPDALQHPRLGEACITIDKKKYPTSKFNQIVNSISTPIRIDALNHGSIEIGYRKGKIIDSKPFLPEEKNLIKAVAREFTLIINRLRAEEERKKLQLQLQHVERLALIGELTAGIAHELNEPLARILGFAQLIKKSDALTQQQDDDLERIIKASLYSREVIKKLMFFSRQMPRQITNVNLNEVISNILYFIDARYHGNKILIHKKLQTPLPTIQADAVQMSQVLVNLITNAIHAMPKGGDLVISTNSKTEYVSLVVKDTGCGMPLATKKKIFEPFFTTKPVGQGTGLGLAVVQGIVTAHQGKIIVQSKQEKGTRFEVQLPIKQKKK